MAVQDSRPRDNSLDSTAPLLAEPDSSSTSSDQPSKPSLPLRLLSESGLLTLLQAPLDTKLLCIQRLVRYLAYGSTTLILVAHLSLLGNSDQRIGLFMFLTLWGDIAISMVLTLYADRIGRKLILVIGSALMVGSGVVFALSTNYWIMLAAAVFGVISPSGNEVGPFRAVEESILAHVTEREKRSDVFAWYAFLGMIGSSSGVLGAGWMLTKILDGGMDKLPAYQLVFWIYSAMGLVKLCLSLMLSRSVEAEAKQKSLEHAETTDEEQSEALLNGGEPSESNGQSTNSDGQTKPNKSWTSLLPSFRRDTVRLLFELGTLFAIDSFASGMISLSWITYFFKTKFNLEEGKLGSIFSVTVFISALTVLVASAIAKRLGNVKTMAFTHLPSAIALILIPIPSTLTPSIVFVVMRALLQNMDVAPRTALMANLIPSDERTGFMGIINVVKTLFQSFGPLITGVLAGHGHFGTAFIIGGCLKAAYDLSFLALFIGREEKAQEKERREAESAREPQSDSQR